MHKFISMIIFNLLLVCTARTAEDPLFPEYPPGKNHILAGLALIKKFNNSENDHLTSEQPIVRCETDYETNNKNKYYFPNGINFPTDFQENPGKYVGGNNNLSLCVGFGCSKRIIKLNPQSDTVVLIGLNKELAIKECQAFQVLNAFGLISQQNPQIVTVQFNEKTIDYVPLVSSFDCLVQYTQRTIWETKLHTCLGFASVNNGSVFNGNENLFNLDYNFQLLAPLARDLALWYLLGAPGGNGKDSLNLMFKQRDNQTFCRLFLFDFFDKYDSSDEILFNYDNIYNVINIIHTMIEQNECLDSVWDDSIQNRLNDLRRSFKTGTYPLVSDKELDFWKKKAKERLDEALWEDWKQVSESKHQLDKDLWNHLQPLLKNEFLNELVRLVELFVSAK